MRASQVFDRRGAALRRLLPLQRLHEGDRLGLWHIHGFSRGRCRRDRETRRFTKTGGSGDPTARYFCPDCGSTVYGDGGEANPGRDITIYAGTLDDPEQFHPQAAIFTRSRPSWAYVMGDIPQFEAMVPY